MSKLPLTIAVSRYDHVNDILTAAVPVEGIDLNPLDLPLHDIFFRFIHFKDFDVAELSMAKYVSMISQGDDSLIALPVFPSRVPRHSAIYVRRDGPVKQPADLAGRRVGVPEWAQTAGVYARGLLMHEFGVDLAAGGSRESKRLVRRIVALAAAHLEASWSQLLQARSEGVISAG